MLTEWIMNRPEESMHLYLGYQARTADSLTIPCCTDTLTARLVLHYRQGAPDTLRMRVPGTDPAYPGHIFNPNVVPFREADTLARVEAIATEPVRHQGEAIVSFLYWQPSVVVPFDHRREADVRISD